MGQWACWGVLDAQGLGIMEMAEIMGMQGALRTLETLGLQVKLMVLEMLRKLGMLEILGTMLGSLALLGYWEIGGSENVPGVLSPPNIFPMCCLYTF